MARSCTVAASHGRSHPPSASSRSASAAVKPQMSMPLTRKAGMSRPPGTRTISRAAGSASSPTPMRSTAATSPGSTGATAPGCRHQASTGMTRNPVRGMNSSGKVASTSTPAGSTPTSSAASRNAAATGPESAASMAPPGKAGCPAWCRRTWLRWMNSRSGPRAVSANKTSTADGLPPVSGGSAAGVICIVVAAAASRRSHAGALLPRGERSSPDPPCSWGGFAPPHTPLAVTRTGRA